MFKKVELIRSSKDYTNLCGQQNGYNTILTGLEPRFG